MTASLVVDAPVYDIKAAVAHAPRAHVAMAAVAHGPQVHLAKATVAHVPEVHLIKATVARPPKANLTKAAAARRPPALPTDKPKPRARARVLAEEDLKQFKGANAHVVVISRAAMPTFATTQTWVWVVSQLKEADIFVMYDLLSDLLDQGRLQRLRILVVPPPHPDSTIPLERCSTFNLGRVLAEIGVECQYPPTVADAILAAKGLDSEGAIPSTVALMREPKRPFKHEGPN
ncbi:hypothetical protein DFQ27_004883 [Actinomortierella ambigua]|uniref:Uncharacterized protein n=1 Tax=Actinomortierella ambigua TaxID=1343610 RepID=A0A9P6U2P9_9FUNG|nr:hypothetical protein DFQ27_004883 [Actinomortierella ambigua]